MKKMGRVVGRVAATVVCGAVVAACGIVDFRSRDDTEPADTEPTRPAVTAAVTAADPTHTPRPIVVVLAEGTITVYDGAAGNPTGQHLNNSALLWPTGLAETVEGVEWAEVWQPGAEPGWVASTNVAPLRTPAELDRDGWQPTLDTFATALAEQDPTGLADTIADRGFYVAAGDHELAGWAADNVADLFDDTSIGWPDDTYATFNERVGDPFVADWSDPDRTVQPGAVPCGHGCVGPWWLIPKPLAGFAWVAVHDPGDRYGGRDWSTWLVFFDYPADSTNPRIVGLAHATAPDTNNTAPNGDDGRSNGL